MAGIPRLQPRGGRQVCLDETGRVIAFYSFKFVTVRASDMPSKGIAKGFDVNANGTVLLLCWMGLAGDYQHQGLGNVLFREIMEMARAAYVIAPFQLMVADAIPGMEGFYKSKGFYPRLKTGIPVRNPYESCCQNLGTDGIGGFRSVVPLEYYFWRTG